MERVEGTIARFEARERAVENGSTPSKMIAVQKNLEDRKSPSGVNGRMRSTETIETSESMTKELAGRCADLSKKGQLAASSKPNLRPIPSHAAWL